MPYHDSPKELKAYLEERGLWDRKRWEKLKSLGLDTIQHLGFAFRDINSPEEATQKENMLKQIEGDWTKEVPQLDDQGQPMKRVKEQSLSLIHI